MNRIDAIFQKLSAENKAALMPFLVAGYPNLDKSLMLLRKLAETADLLEIGFPYSDPLADGPVIQQADQEALSQGLTTQKVFNLIKNLRQHTEVPITVLVYANLVYQRGIAKFYQDAARAGIDGVLIPDVPAEEMSPFVRAARRYGVYNICLVSPNTVPSRLKNIFSNAQGYIYLTSVAGITGARKDVPRATLQYLKSLSKVSPLPIAVGFGISNARQVKKLKQNGARGIIVGSRIISMVAEQGLKLKPQKIVKFLEDLMNGK